MKQRYAQPLPETAIESIVKSWANIAKYPDSGSFYYYSLSDLRYRFHWLSSYSHIVSAYLSQYNLFVIDLAAHGIEDENDIQDLLDRHISKRTKKIPLIAVLDIESWIRQGRVDILGFFQNYHIAHQDVSFLFFFEHDMMGGELHTLLQPYPIFFKNSVYHPLHSRLDAMHFIQYQCREWNISYTESDLLQLSELSGGHLWIARELVRIKRSGIAVDTVQTLLNLPNLRFKIEHIWHEFSDRERVCLIEHVKASQPVNESSEYQFLMKTGWISQANDQSSPIGILAEYIKTYMLQRQIFLNEKNMLVTDGSIGSLPRQQKRLLTLFLKNSGRVITRDMVAQAIWGESWNNLYSDWAIDQAISRLRSFFIAKKIQGYQLITLQKRGYQLNSHYGR